MNRQIRYSFYIILMSGILFSACSTTETALTKGDFQRSNTDAKEVVSTIPDYTESLRTVSGKGRAIVSEPRNSDRVSIDFQADQEKSLLTIQNRIGIEGGQLLADQDSILIYNRVDDFAQKMSIYNSSMTSLNELASINILDLMNFKVRSGDVNSVLESDKLFQLRMDQGVRVFVSRSDGTVQQVVQTQRSVAPYSKIIYESYGTLEGFTLPRKITIFSADERSRVVFLVRSLNLNPNDLKLSIDIPDNIKIQRL